jgi:hypothetical protein
MRMRFAVAFAVLCLVITPTSGAAQQTLDTAYSRQIRAYTSEPRFNTELTDHLVRDPRVPTPFDVLGYVPGTPGRLSYTADVNRYFRALAAASPRVRVFEAGRSDDGREMIAVAIADEPGIAALDTYRDVTRRLADPRGLAEADARALIARGRPIYYLTGSIHSPETGSPEMLMELAYRLAVEDTPMLRSIREKIITVITPIQETDGRDRMVDVYNYGRAHNGVRPPLVYWGKYTAHDNNRDGMVISQALTRNMLAQYFYWHPTVQHDLHESVPFLYTSTGTGPYNRAIDPITISEWNELAFQEIKELTRRGLPGVWTHDFYDGWAPNYVMFIANLRGSVGRFYETYTSFGAECDTARLARTATSVEWFRPNPPLDGIRWCIRNNINYQQSGVLVALNYVADNASRYLEDFWVKAGRAVERGRTGRPNIWHIPAAQPRRVEAADLVNLLRLHGIEVHRANAAFMAGGTSVAAGDYVVRLDQPYGPLASVLLETQTYRGTDPAPYDDTGWTFGALRNVAVHAVADSGALAQPMTMITEDVVIQGTVEGEGRGAAILVPATTESNLIVFRYRLRNVRMSAAEDSFSVGARSFPAGTIIIPVGGNGARPVLDAITALGLSAVTVAAVPSVARHDLDLPRIGLVHSWQNTQNEGWVRYAFDHYAIPYTYLSTQQMADSARLARFDVLFLPYISDNARSIVSGQPMVGPPVPWQRTTLTPNLGGIDSTDDVRPGIGLAGLATLQSWLSRGGLLITEGGTSAVPVQYGLAPGVDITEPRTLRVRGSVVRSRVTDRRSPITYGYSDTVSVYFNQTPLFQTDTTAERGTEQARDTAMVTAQRRLRPRVVLRFGRPDSLLVSGLLENGSELASRPAIVDVPVGRGHVVMFAIRPYWRWETQGSFAFGFNALMNWNDLDAGRVTEAPSGNRTRRAGEEDDQGPR